MAKEKKKGQEQGKEGVEKKKEDDDKAQEKEKLLPNVSKEKETAAKEEVKKDEGKPMKENEIQIKNGGEEEEKEQGEKPEAPPAKPKPSQPSPPEEVVLKVFMHCKGCAKKVRKCLKDLEGVEDVKTDCKTNTVVIKGKIAAQDPKKIADALYRKSGKRVEILSPIPVPLLPENVAIVEILEKKKEEKTKEIKESQESVVVALKVNMHCEACAEQIKTRILKLTGVEEAETNLGTSQVNVKGNFDPDMLVKYIYKRTGKHAFIVKQEGIPTEEKLPAAADAKPVDDIKQEDAKENRKKEEEFEEKSEEEKKGDEKNSPTTVVAVTGPGNGSKGIGAQHNFYYYPRYPMEYTYPYPYPYPYPNPFPHHPNSYPYHQYPYVPPPAPAPQIFSDENPNACEVM